eukprot:1272559-Pyramimonas_sp.AAC.1
MVLVARSAPHGRHRAGGIMHASTGWGKHGGRAFQFYLQGQLGNRGTAPRLSEGARCRLLRRPPAASASGCGRRPPPSRWPPPPRGFSSSALLGV